MEWGEPGHGGGLVWLWLRCDRCGAYVRRPSDVAPPRGAHVAEVDWGALRARDTAAPWPRRSLLFGAIAGQLAVLGAMIAWGVSHLPH
jgi:hypothetical protein